MRVMFSVVLLSMLVTLASACPPSPQPPVTDTGCAGACENLERLGCGIQGCEPACTKAQGTLTDIHPACLARAASKEEARACGSVRCP